MRQSKKEVSVQKTGTIGGRMSLLIFIMIVLSTFSIGAFSYTIFRTRSLDDQADYALDFARTTAVSIDPVKLMETIDAKEKNEYWYSVKKRLDNDIKMNRLEYLYIIMPADANTYMYFVDGKSKTGLSKEMDFLSVDLKDDFYSKADEIFASGKDSVTSIYDSGEYGFVISGFSVIKDTAGHPIALVGADISVNNALEQTNRFMWELLIAILLFGVIMVAIATLYVQKSLSRPLQKLSSAFETLSVGVIDNQCANDSFSSRELLMLSQSYEKVSWALQGLMTNISDMTKEHGQGNNEAFIDGTAFHGVYSRVAGGINDMVSEYVSETQEIVDCVVSFGNGDFQTKLRPFPGKKQSANRAVENLRGNLIGIHQEISDMAALAASGDLSKRIDSGRFIGDWSKLTVQLNGLMDVIRMPIDEASAILHQISQGNLNAKVTGDYKGDFALIKDSLNATTDELSVYISEIQTILGKMADNNLDQAITRQYIGEFSNIKDSINNIIGKLNQVMLGFRSAADQVMEGAGILSDSSQHLAIGASHQIEVVSLLSEMVSAVNEKTAANEKNAANAYAISNLSIDNAARGNEKMKEMLQAIDAIRKSAGSISAIVKVISDIAFQINLLAINAAVEAAHAGIHGKGFAVVAEQVRILAARSQKAVRETADMAENTINMVGQGSDITESTVEVLQLIFNNITDVSAIIERIHAASAEQTQAIDQIRQNLERISESVQVNSDESIQCSSLSEELSAQAAELKNSIGEFELRSAMRSQPGSRPAGQEAV